MRRVDVEPVELDAAIFQLFKALLVLFCSTTYERSGVVLHSTPLIPLLGFSLSAIAWIGLLAAAFTQYLGLLSIVDLLQNRAARSKRDENG